MKRIVNISNRYSLGLQFRREQITEHENYTPGFIRDVKKFATIYTYKDMVLFESKWQLGISYSMLLKLSRYRDGVIYHLKRSKTKKDFTTRMKKYRERKFNEEYNQWLRSRNPSKCSSSIPEMNHGIFSD